MSSESTLTETRVPLEEVDKNGPTALMTPRSQSRLPILAKKRERVCSGDSEANISQMVPLPPTKKSKIDTIPPEKVTKKPPAAAKTTRPRPGMTKSSSGSSHGNRPKSGVSSTTAGKPSVSTARSRTRPNSAPHGARTTVARPSVSTASMQHDGGLRLPPSKPKRAAWDYKGRLEDMSKEMRCMSESNACFQQMMQETRERLNVLEEQKQQLTGVMVEKEQVHTKAEEKIRHLEKSLKERDEDIDNLERQLSKLKRLIGDLEGDLNAARQEINGYKFTVSQMTSEKLGLESENSILKRNLEIAKDDLRIEIENCKRKDDMIGELEKTVADRDASLHEHEAKRRLLHNQIQELKGNIRVFCRVRPLVSSEIESGVKPLSLGFPDNDQKVIVVEKAGEESAVGRGKNKDQKYDFTFDKVFDHDSKQSHVFDEISQLVQSALDGYNVCIFAYGQTGSGKTFTMEGPDNADAESMGMIPRAVQQIFKCARDLESKGWQYEMKASYLEIYNESIRDLLGPADSKAKHDIKLTGPKGTAVEVTDTTVIKVTSEQQIDNLLQRASQHRAVAATKCNERSSRSHSVFILNLHGKNELTGEKSEGVLNLVDLAGSERLSQSGSTGSRLKETQNINRSLSELSNVIMAIANKDSYIPYRNSKLTYLLQNSLGGNSKTLMFVNISPKEENFSETVTSLRFATKVNECNIGTAQKR